MNLLTMTSEIEQLEDAQVAGNSVTFCKKHGTSRPKHSSGCRHRGGFADT